MTRSITILKTHFSKQGGAEKYARLLAHAFHERGHPVTVLTTEPVEGDFPFQVVSFHHKSKTSVNKLWDFDFFCQQYLKQHPTDIVFGLDRNRHQTHIRASNGVHKSYLEHRKQFEPKWKSLRHLLNPLHSSLLHIEKASFEQEELQVLFTNSHLVKNEILSHYNVDPKKIRVIHNGVEWNDWQYSFEETFTTSRKDPYNFLFIGNNYQRKGLIPLLYGLRHLQDVHLTVVGTDKNQKKFETLAVKLGLEKKVSFKGQKLDIIPFLQQADCLVIPSFYDPFANVTIEALAMGLFVISSATNGASEILTEESGFIIKDLSDEEAMKEALTIALKHPKTQNHALAIRNSVKYLDLSNQLGMYLATCLSPT